MLRFTFLGFMILIAGLGQLNCQSTDAAPIIDPVAVNDTEAPSEVTDEIPEKNTEAGEPFTTLADPIVTEKQTVAAEDEQTTKKEETTQAPETTVTTEATTTTTTTEKPTPMLTVASTEKEGILMSDDGIYKGLIVDVLNKISKELGFKYQISTVASIEAADAQLEYIEKDETKNLTFSPIMTVEMEPEEIDNFDPDLFLIFRPFTTGVWLLILFAFVLIGMSLFLFNICHPHEHMAAASRGKSSNHDARYFHIQGSYWTAFSTLTLQGYERKPRTCAGRILLGFWFLFVIFTFVLYIASMFNILSASHQIIQEAPEENCHPSNNFALAYSKGNTDLVGLVDSVNKLKENGEMLEMQKKWFDCPEESRSKRDDDLPKTVHMQIGINSFSGAIIILCIGLVFAIVIALLEVCCYKNKKKASEEGPSLAVPDMPAPRPRPKKQVPTSHTKENLLAAEEGQATSDGMKDATDV